jgi:hypothetical protein
MSRDDKVIGYFSLAEMQALLGETGMVSVQETGQAGGQAVIHAALKVINAESGAELPGGLPFSVVLFKEAREPGFSNIAIGTVVPAAELKLVLPPDFFNLCNRRYRFVRAFPCDANSFVLQMDMFLHNATREYVKFGFGVWGALFTNVLFELMGNNGQSLAAAAEVYAGMEERFAGTVTEAPEVPLEKPLPETPAEAAADVETVLPEARPEAVTADLPAEESAPAAADAVEAAGGPVAEPAAEPAVEPPAEPAAELPAEIPGDQATTGPA